MPGHRRSRKFWKSLLAFFLIYFIVVPAIYYILDPDVVVRHFTDDPGLFILKMAGIAMGIALILTIWTRRDPELKRW